MDHQAQNLKQRILYRYRKQPAHLRLLVAIAGCPGSGKSTFGKKLVKLINDAESKEGQSLGDGITADTTILVPLDGFHFTRSHLDSMPDPVEARRRRGAPFAFDAGKYVQLLRELRAPIAEPRDADATTDNHAGTIFAPSYDHAIHDPVETNVRIETQHRIVVVEGFYTAFSEPPWDKAARLFDTIIFIQIDPKVAVERLMKRHLAGGATDAKGAKERAEGSDAANGAMILQDRVSAEAVDYHVVQSVPDEL